MTSNNRYSTSPAAADQLSSRDSTTRIARLLILAGVLILLVWLGLKAWRVYQSAQSLLAIEPEAGARRAGGVEKIESVAGEARVR